MSKVAKDIYRTRTVRDEHSNIHPIDSNIEEYHGEFLGNFITEHPDIVRTMEIGCAYGLSSLYICDALRERDRASHIIVDPFQSTTWQNIGITNLKRDGIDFFTLVEERSEYYLPRIAQNQSADYDFIFIDGWHTFDHTLIDLFYALRLVRVGGYIIVDDCDWPAVSKVISYFVQYPCLQVVRHSDRAKMTLLQRIIRRLCKGKSNSTKPAPPYGRMVAFHKIAEDDRRWDWFEKF